MTNKMRRCSLSFIGNPYWTDPRLLFKTNFTEIEKVAQDVLDSAGFAEATGLDWFSVSVTVAFFDPPALFNPPPPVKVIPRLRTSKKHRSVLVSWDIFPRQFPQDAAEADWVSVYIALLADSIERALHKFKIDTSEVRRLRSISPRQINLVEHFGPDVYTPYSVNAKTLDTTEEEAAASYSPPPELIAINHDDYHAKYVGRTSDGRQFFLTNPFLPALQDAGNEFLALYLFDENGNLLDAKIDEFGSRGTMDDDAAWELRETRLTELGPVTFGRIQVKPFCIERFGTSFGLIAVSLDDDTGSWWVEVQPGNYMAFREPWDSGEYDT